ncbi:hypothetical protein MGYG_01817 [Nannizzia gypsea CBS 118893]|uniref:Protein prenyltransferase n=1 Tax=Arthroderma gypseum (strain ATCC MYA-4604 / CBS 118893) TaxID=535722 RepID=E5R3K2_ARTGP|nr:hypothetical protein MGYG_01817 [Nannizzia gypsea CBS 118893]EFQ98801.1 hypothetical protein MGYG_01817 [Nannizzia gypsea CBS 118893]
MSTPATDTDSASSLDAHIYDTLASIGKSERTVEIEILPGALGPLLTDDDGSSSSIGITKKALIQAFITARGVFFASNPTPEDEGDDDVVAAASTVILVFDSEHLTACNWRKRRIVRSLSKQGSDAIDRPPPSPSPLPLLCAECNFTASLLGSPLHRHAKSPTLWYHRFWLMQVYLRHQHHYSYQQPKAEMLKREVELVLRAAEHHPMNYYAFSYLRQYLALLSGSDGGLDDRSKLITTYEVGVKVEAEHDRGNIATTAPETGGGNSRLISDAHLITTMRDWCLRNPGDNSGWMFLLHVLTLVRDGGNNYDDGNDDVVHDVVQRVIQFGRAVQWQREALWTFVELARSRLGAANEEEEAGQAEGGLHVWHDWGQDRGQGPAALELDGPVANETLTSMPPGPRPWKRWTRQVGLP